MVVSGGHKRLFFDRLEEQPMSVILEGAEEPPVEVTLVEDDDLVVELPKRARRKRRWVVPGPRRPILFIGFPYFL